MEPCSASSLSTRHFFPAGEQTSPPPPNAFQIDGSLFGVLTEGPGCGPGGAAARGRPGYPRHGARHRVHRLAKTWSVCTVGGVGRGGMCAKILYGNNLNKFSQATRNFAVVVNKSVVFQNRFNCFNFLR